MQLTSRHVLFTLALAIAATIGILLYLKEPGVPIALVSMIGLVLITIAAARMRWMDLGDVEGAIRRAQRGERPVAARGASLEMRRVMEALSNLVDDHLLANGRREAARAHNELSKHRVLESTARIRQQLLAQKAAANEAGRLVRHANQTFAELARKAEQLRSVASESVRALGEMNSSQHEVAENAGELAKSVRETVSSIEQMAFAIREVAKNVDALALTAEETNSSMNEMDVSIDQVQSNANETARLSEQVTHDAEKGTEAIVKTMSEINRIKESSLEAVSAISTLGTRIDAIGQIVNVIDDVAEQTNLLALNAAIIAAQAGEHGKGFAVVADEIKDLAERAGASTREITDLIKTVQAESRNAITAVQRGATNVERGVEVSNEAERALKKILESSQKSTNMVRAIARATVEQSKGSKQVTDAIGRIAETVQQIATSTTQQARGSELVMKGAEKMRAITQAVERGSQEHARGSRRAAGTMETIATGIEEFQSTIIALRQQDQATNAITRIEESDTEAALDTMANELSKLTE